MTQYNDEAEIEASRAPLMDHLVELRERLIVSVAALVLGFVICFVFSQNIYIFLLHPFDVAGGIMAEQKNKAIHHGPFDMILMLTGFLPTPPAAPLKMVFTAPLEFFFTKVKLAGIAGLVLAFPVIAWQIYGFVSPGLYKRERMAFLPFLMASPFLFLLGASLVYYVMLPFVLWFSLNQEIVGAGNVSVELLPKVSDYLSLVTTLLLAFGLCFQMPVVLALLGLANLITSKILASGRRYAIVGVGALAMVVTPPDPFSMIALIIPLCLLYEVSIWCVRLIELRRKAEDVAEDSADA